jgi:hypothetical protein
MDAEQARGGLSVAMEQELYRLLGRLLGTLEAMATDVQEPVQGRQRAWLQQALDSGHELKEHLEALAFLASPSPEERLVRAPYSVRRMVEHAVRAAGWQASEQDVDLTLPAMERWSERSVNVDVRAIDRVIRGLCEHLVLTVGSGGRVEVTLSEEQDGLRVALHGEPPARGESPEASARADRAPRGPSELLFAAWQCIATLHGGRLGLEIAQLTATLWLPLCRD